jgi:hypothetical protein
MDVYSMILYAKTTLEGIAENALQSEKNTNLTSADTIKSSKIDEQAMPKVNNGKVWWGSEKRYLNPSQTARQPA